MSAFVWYWLGPQVPGAVMLPGRPSTRVHKMRAAWHACLHGHLTTHLPCNFPPTTPRCRVGGAWRSLPRPSPGTAVLLFGICTAWRSNERIPAAEHRVADAPAATASHRRLSAVLFVGACGWVWWGGGWVVFACLQGWLCRWCAKLAPPCPSMACPEHSQTPVSFCPVASRGPAGWCTAGAGAGLQQLHQVSRYDPYSSCAT